MFDFPASPTDGTIYAPAGGPQYQFSGGAWRVASSSVPITTAQARNRIVNGAMQISQENGNTGTANTASLAFYFADQWAALSSTSPGLANAARVQSVTPKGSKDRVRITVGTAKAALAAGDYLLFQSSIEGIRVADFQWGTAQAKQAVVRFGFKGPAGTYSFSIVNGTPNRAYLANFTISAGQANTDTEQTFIILGDVTGTWPTDTARGMYFQVCMGAGTTWQGVAGWQAGNLMGTSATSNGMATAGNVFELFDVGLYLDPLATGIAPPWTMPDEAQEQSACQRYWTSLQAYVPLAADTYAMTFPVEMRVAPAVAGGGAGFTTASLNTRTFGFRQTTAAFQTMLLSARM